MGRLTSPGTALLVVTLAVVMTATAADAYQSRGRMLLLEIKKEEKSTGSTPPSYKSESKTTGEWKVTEKKEFKDKGPAVFKKETKNPPQTVVSTTKEEYKGQEQGVYKNTKDDKGNKVVFLDTGKRHFEYNSVTTHTVNFPQTTVIANGGEPATFIYEKKVVAPVKESKAVYMSGAGPTFTQKWTATGKGASAPAGKDGGDAKGGGGEAKEGGGDRR